MYLADSGQARGRRDYHSPLRESQAAATHDRVLAAVVRIMANGVSELSMPAVAKEADVSVATVYRHFPNKGALLTALPEYFARQSGMDRPWQVPASWAEFEATIRRIFGAYERFDEVARAALVSQLGHRARQAQLPERIEFSRAALTNLAPSLDADALERVNRLALVLVSSSSFRMYRALGRTVAQAADDAVWAIRTAIRAEERP